MTDIFEPKTPHYNQRTPVMLILHGTGVDAVQTIEIFTGKTGREASCPYMIDKQGNVVQFLDDSVRAWHAGVSYWAGFTNINSMSVGIEIECAGDDESFEWPESEYNALQLQATVELSKKIVEKYKILPHNILAHQDIAPYRKVDPGPRFDWAFLAKQGIGLWHDLEKIDNDPVITDQKQIEEFKQKLFLFGYDPRPNADGKDYSWVVKAFQTHFLPWNICGQVTEQSVRALNILLEKKFSI